MAVINKTSYGMIWSGILNGEAITGHRFKLALESWQNNTLFQTL